MHKIYKHDQLKFFQDVREDIENFLSQGKSQFFSGWEIFLSRTDEENLENDGALCILCGTVPRILWSNDPNVALVGMANRSFGLCEDCILRLASLVSQPDQEEILGYR